MATCVFIYFATVFIYFEQERIQSGTGQTERQRERIPGRLHTVSTEPNMGLDPQNHEIMT